MIVVDASAMLEILLNAPAAALVRTRLYRPGETIHAPHLLDLEVTQTLRRYVLAGQLSSSRGLEGLSSLNAFPLTRYPHIPLLPRIWELRHNLTAYDAAYIALAEALAAPLLTRDAALASVRGHSAIIELLAG